MKILYVATGSGTINGFLVPHINLLLDQGHQVDIACNVWRPINPKLIDKGCKVFDIEFQRSPIKKQNFSAFAKLKTIVEKERYDVVHTHTPIASMFVRLACKYLGNTKVIYTAHGFHFYSGAPLKNWLMYYPVEKYLSKYTDVLITINKEDFMRAKSNFRAGSVEHIPGVGIDTVNYANLIVNKGIVRRKMGVPEDGYILLSVGELNRNKNHETVIRSLSKLKNNKLYYVIAGEGKYRSILEKLSEELGVNKQVKLLGHRKDIIEICKSVDLFVFPSFREGSSVALMEAMACGLPVVCSDIRGNRDLIESGKGGFLVKPPNVEGFTEAIMQVYNNKNYAGNMGEYSRSYVKKFDTSEISARLNTIYKNITRVKCSE